MSEIPKEHRVLVKVRYNGYLHRCLAIRNGTLDNLRLHIFSDQFPKGYKAENDDNELVFTELGSWVLPDPSGEHGWICSEVIDIDAFARS